MRRVRIDKENMVAVVQPGVTLAELDEVTARHALVYQVLPGEHGASIGGNIGTNAGGSRAVKYRLTRHHVLGLEMVLACGTVLKSGGKFVKVSSGYDLTQLIIGSKGTLALVTKATLRLYHRPRHQSTVLAPFRDLAAAMRRRTTVMRELLQAGMALGGAISGEHGIGTVKKEYYQSLEDPEKLDLPRRIKMAFDPTGILNPGVIFDWPAVPEAVTA